MSNRAKAWDKPWLVGGGPREPWSYRQLSKALSQPPTAGFAAQCVAEVLLELTRCLYHAQPTFLRSAGFVGEGVAVGVPPACDDETLVANLYEMVSRLLVNRATEITLESSGSSGSANVVTHRLENLLRGVVVNQRHRDDVWALAFDPAHIAGVQVYLQALANANTVVNLWGLDYREAIKRCQEWRVTHLSATPTFYRLLLPLEPELPDVRSVSTGGETADVRLFGCLRERFPNARVHNIYASTEAGTLLASDGTEFTVPDSNAGFIRIAEGRLSVNRCLLGQFAGAGEWYDTGDAVEVVATSPLRFRVVGRHRSRVNIGGEKVNPIEIESVLTEYPLIVAARVFGRRNSVTGEILAADLVARDVPPAEADVREYLARCLPGYKIPRIIRFVDQLEMTRSGKVARHV